ncbi:hydroxyacid dehydrogenase [Microvirga subterranea]|uniref:D-lactate dehydrogenase n=1 Tax=Microvirga subterranea TaxID=186651 RepID=A0A370HGZ6_9HYPH|nr:hydroxyacid dehydrogenase [Microvirga subterranea]RDI57174.1 D-lactate dehydrogenase [Microvirga subterranea]
MKVAVFETEQWEHEACLRLQPDHAVTCTHERLTGDTVVKYADAEIVSPFVYSRLDAGVLAQLPRLKLVATRSTGHDHIDLGYCRAHGVTVCNVPDYGDHTVAEHAFALLLAVSRHLVEAVDRTRRGNFSQSGLRGFDLHGRTLGVIGTGRIGRRVVGIAKGFGMDVVAFDIESNEKTAHRMGFRYAPLDDILTAADVVTLHVPATPQTIGLLSDREFGLMKPGAVLINTARGNVVDVAALVRALAGGRLAAAGLDVLPEEPAIREEAEIFRAEAVPVAYDLRALVANHVLLRFPNVIVTPHNAYNTDGAIQRIIETTLGNIEAFVRGEPRNVVA